MATAPLPAETIVGGSDPVANAAKVSLSLKQGALERNAGRRLPYGEMKLVRKPGIPAARIPEAYGGLGVRFGQLAEIMVRPAAANPNVAQNIQPHFVLLDLLNLQGIALVVCFATSCMLPPAR